MRELSLLLVGLLLGACADSTLERREVFVFGTGAEITLRGPDRAQLAAAADDVERLWAGFDRDWHPWRDSALTRINAAFAAGQQTAAPASILRLIEASRPLVAASAGTFDPAAGGLVRAWGFHTSDWPAQSEADAALIGRWPRERPHFDDLQVAGDRLRSVSTGLLLDFNAIAEGVAIADALSLLRARGVRDALLDLGGDVVALGNAGGRAWRVALRDPGGGVLGWVALADGEGLFASGGYAKYREDEGRRRSHVVDPRSGQATASSLASAVLSDDPPLADAAATALLASGPAEFEQRVDGLGVGCALLLAEGDVLHITSTLRARVTLLRQPAQIIEHDAPASCRARRAD